MVVSVLLGLVVMALAIGVFWAAGLVVLRLIDGDWSVDGADFPCATVFGLLALLGVALTLACAYVIGDAFLGSPS